MIIFVQYTFAQKSGTTWPMNGLVRVYFNHPVDTAVSSGSNAVYLHNLIGDTLIQYIKRAKYSIDCAIYDATYDGTYMAPVINAIDSAYPKGIAIRWIDNGSSSNSAISHLTSGINHISSPTTSAYGIMHCKFMVIDGNSDSLTDPIVWTGSTNWSAEQFNSDWDNVIIFQDSGLAHAYTREFNEMWGSTTTTPNSANSKFGPDKTDPLWTHHFTIGGSTVDLWFSPTDNTESHIINALNSANTDLYFGVYTFTEGNMANAIIARHSAGVLTAGIMDSYSEGYPPYTTLSAALGPAYFKIFNETYSCLYHNKFAIIDPSNPSSDPQVVTGSHNWSSTANYYNDENTVIVHNAVVANMYYQEFYQNFIDIGGSPFGLNDVNPVISDVNLYPNPAIENSPVYLNINSIMNFKDTKFVIIDMLGNKLNEISIRSKQTVINCSTLAKGMYFYQLFNNDKLLKTAKFLIQ